MRCLPAAGCWRRSEWRPHYVALCSSSSIGVCRAALQWRRDIRQPFQRWWLGGLRVGAELDNSNNNNSSAGRSRFVAVEPSGASFCAPSQVDEIFENISTLVKRRPLHEFAPLKRARRARAREERAASRGAQQLERAECRSDVPVDRDNRQPFGSADQQRALSLSSLFSSSLFRKSTKLRELTSTPTLTELPHQPHNQTRPETQTKVD